MFLLFAVHVPVVMTAVTLLKDTGRDAAGRSLGQIARTLLRSPIVVALLVGGAIRLVGVLPGGLLKGFLDSISGTASTCALIAIGLLLSRYHLARQWPASFSVVALKLLVHPFVVWLLAFHALGLPRGGDVVRSASDRHQHLSRADTVSRGGRSRTIILLSTAISIFNLSF